MTNPTKNARATTHRNGALPLLLLGSAFALSAFDVPPAHARESDLVTKRVDDAVRMPLPGHQVRWASAANDRGPVPATLALTHLSLDLKRSPELQQAFDAYLLEQRDPSSPNYQHWLTPSEIGERFGASQHDIDAVSNWLASQGLKVEKVSNSRMQIRFSGDATDVAEAFGTELHYFQVGNERRMAPAQEPKVPDALKNITSGVLGLSSVRFEPQHRTGTPITSAAAGSQFSSPAMTNCTRSPCAHYVTPGDFSAIYDVTGAASQGLTGAGQTIAIIGRARVNNADLQAFGKLMNVTMKTPTVIVPPDGTDPGPAATTCSDTGTPSCTEPSELVKDQAEATLDVTRAGSVAPGADIALIISGETDGHDGLNYAIDYAIDHEPLVANIISVSFGSCEAKNSQAVANYLDSLFAQGAMQGQSVFVSSGDAGAADCADYFTAPVAGLSRSTNVICASGHATCVGGTSFASDADTYWNATNSAGYVSAIGYIPEGAWNEPLDDNDKPQVAATGGGTSVYITKPSWQVGPGVPANAYRNVPDVSFGASTKNGYFGCLAAQGASCVPGSDGRFTFQGWGGTSASAPSMAGVTALLNQSRGAAQGNLNPTLYALGANAANGVFHDVTVQSSNISNCSIETASLCNNTLPGTTNASGGLQGYAVGTGYDLATGLGSIDVAKLLDQWGNATPVAVNLNQHGLSGAWYNPLTNGQGIVLEVSEDQYGPGLGSLFGGWFTFDVTAAGGQRWYTVQGQVSANSASATLPIYLTQGGRFDTPSSTEIATVGSATLSFSDCLNGTLAYTFSDGSGRSGIIPLTRLNSNVDCIEGSAAATTTNAGLAGTWYEPATSGQGFVFDVDPLQNNFFAAWYTYANTMQTGPAGQRWYTLQATFKPGTSTLNGIGIYSTTGGAFNQSGASPAVQVGTATMVFHSCSSATLNYHFANGTNGGQSGTIELTRLFLVPAGCHL